MPRHPAQVGAPPQGRTVISMAGVRAASAPMRPGIGKLNRSPSTADRTAVRQSSGGAPVAGSVITRTQ
ncbi:hypothetical protein ACFQV2_22175 [Actinokineospora soli]|uniref:Uncharacterized protein n=1 Tax=Actinokineospora soli TaxID=1048753 RepID=A0ABW2TQ24_9PSEU